MQCKTSVPVVLLPPSSELGKHIRTFSGISLLKVVRVFWYMDGKFTRGKSRPDGCRLCVEDEMSAVM